MSNMANLTPMMRQYLEIKEKHKNHLLLYRLGDFYELFFEDAVTASTVLGITLTGRDCGLEERAPMCGVPYHAVDSYVDKLVKKNYTCAICDQLSDPKAKGIVERGVTRIITPGTVIEDNILEKERNNYIACVSCCENEAGICSCDVSTGAFLVCELKGENVLSAIAEELSRISPAEVIYPESISLSAAGIINSSYFSSAYADSAFDREYAKKILLAHFGALPPSNGKSIEAAGALLTYINETQKNSLIHIKSIQFYSRFDYMSIDLSTRNNLEITQTIKSEGNRRNTLLGQLTKTKTSMGARMLREWLDKPLQDKAKINRRLSAVEELKSDYVLRDVVSKKLALVYDIERLCSKMVYGSFNARDALSLHGSLSVMPGLIVDLACTGSERLAYISRELDDFGDVTEMLGNSIAEDPPASTKDGGIIKAGYNTELDQIRIMATDGKDALRRYEAGERERTGIKNLKIGFNKVFGYFIEVSKSNLGSVPFYFHRKQTISTGERFITDELVELQEAILGASERSIALEAFLFNEIREILKTQIQRFQKSALLLSELDIYQSFATVASLNGYCKPEIVEGGAMQIIDGRHPVVEAVSKGSFVANDTFMDVDENRFLVITGPNMAGKSTYMRQIALITIMAHLGSFVPAKIAKIPIVDRIFARVGASDDLSSGRSTFMVEMSETANILHNATEKSLVLLDEIGRGTSTYDGLAIAWAVVEYIADKSLIGAKTLFATHFHELSELEGKCEGVVNYRIAAKEIGDQIVFIRKIMKGGTDKSFGIQVAKLAGVPDEVISRAKQIRNSIESADVMIFDMAGEENGNKPKAKKEDDIKLVGKIVKILKDTDVNTTTPLEALAIITELKDAAAMLDALNG